MAFMQVVIVDFYASSMNKGGFPSTKANSQEVALNVIVRSFQAVIGFFFIMFCILLCAYCCERRNKKVKVNAIKNVLKNLKTTKW